MNADEIIGNYILLRNWIAKRSAEHAEELRPANEAMAKYEAMGAALLVESSGAEEGKANIVTPHGTMFRKRWTSITCADRPTFFSFVAGDWEARNKFLTSAVTKKEIEEWIEVEKAVPPGLNVARGYSVQFNSPKG